MSGTRPNEVKWDEQSASRVWSLAQNDPYITSCARVLCMYVFGDGMKVQWVRGEDTYDSHEDFQQHVHAHWQPFATELMQNLLMFGVCPYKVVTLPSGDAVPVVPTFGTYFLTVQPTADYSLHYRCYRNPCVVNAHHQQQQEDTDMHVLVMNHLDATGGLHGPISTILHLDAFVNDQMRNTTVANWISSNPTIVTTSQQKSEPRMEHHMHSAFTTSAQQQVQNSDRMRARDSHNIDALQRQVDAIRDLNATQNSTMRDSNTVVEKDSFSNQMQTRQHCKQYEQNCLPLPHGQTITNQVLPRAPHDLLYLLKWKEDTICAVMGVPRSLFGGKEGAGAAVGIKNSVNMRMLVVTVTRWKNTLATHLERVYWSVYGADSMLSIAEGGAFPPPLQHASAAAAKRRKLVDTAGGNAGPCSALPVSRQQADSSDRHSEISGTDTEPATEPQQPRPSNNKNKRHGRHTAVPRVNFVFPFVPTVSVEEISYLFDRGVIDHETEAEYLCKSLGMPMSSITMHESLVDKQLEVTQKAKAVQPGTADNTQYKQPI